MNQFERVCRAICKACGENPDHDGDARGNKYRWQDYGDAAMAAIAAINEPTASDWIFRSDDCIPTPPDWARGYCLQLRQDANPDFEFSLQSDPLYYWRWMLLGDNGDIIAIRWLP